MAFCLEPLAGFVYLKALTSLCVNFAFFLCSTLSLSSSATWFLSLLYDSSAEWEKMNIRCAKQLTTRIFNWKYITINFLGLCACCPWLLGPVCVRDILYVRISILRQFVLTLGLFDIFISIIGELPNIWHAYSHWTWHTSFVSITFIAIRVFNAFLGISFIWGK